MEFNTNFTMMIYGFIKLFKIKTKGPFFDDQEIKCNEGQNTTGMVYYPQTEVFINFLNSAL